MQQQSFVRQAQQSVAALMQAVTTLEEMHVCVYVRPSLANIYRQAKAP